MDDWISWILIVLVEFLALGRIFEVEVVNAIFKPNISQCFAKKKLKQKFLI